MCDIVNKFIDLMKPYVLNIEVDYHKLKEKENTLNSLDSILKAIDDNSFKIFDIEYNELDEFLKSFNSNKQVFEANKYIIQTEIEEVKALPQYQSAKKYIDDFNDYLINEFSKLENECHELSDNYEEKKLINNDMFANDKIFVDNEVELKKIFEILDMTIELKNDILICILKENNKSYNNDNNQIFTDSEKEIALEIIKNNKELDRKDYNELIEAVDEYVDLSKKIDEIVSHDLIKKINVCNIVLAKKIWLYRKIKFSYYNMNCRKCNCIVKEFNYVCDLYEKIKQIRNQEDVVRIIKGES